MRWLLLALAAGLLAAVEIAGVTFPDTVAAGGRTLALRGAGALKVKLVFTAYAAALHVDQAAAGADPLGEVARRLELHYFHAIAAKDFVAATEATIGRGLPPGELAALRPAIDAFNALYVDIAPGQRYALTYLPGGATELARDGVVLGSVPGAAFARALFAIWLGEQPLDAGLRRALRGERR